MGDAAGPHRGNFVSEWFGHRVFPVVAASDVALDDQSEGRCPFLTVALREETHCVKPASSKGICTISSPSNGMRQDWLVCPYRALTPVLLHSAVERLFGTSGSDRVLIIPAPTLAREDIRREIRSLVASGGRAFAFFQDKLGGEISVPPTDRSPELAFDVTIAELVGSAGALGIARYGILEVQTMDFHGSYRHAVKNLEDALRLHGDHFHATIRANLTWLSDRIEGPNIANVFKRTFYQMILKFQIGKQGACAGCVLAIPQSVWDSWQRHLGRPELAPNADGTFSLYRANHDPSRPRTAAWIFVFDVDASELVSPNRIVLKTMISTDAGSVSHFALEVAPENALGPGGSADRVLETVKRRLADWWTDFGGVG